MTENLTWEMLVSKAMDKAENVFAAVGNAVSNAVTEYGADAVNAVLMVVRINIVEQLVYGIIVLALYVMLLRFIWIKCLKRNYAENNNSINRMDDYVVVPSLVVIVFSTVIVAFSPASAVISPWTYVGIYEPKLWIAKKVVDKIEKAADEATKSKSKSK